MLQIFEVNPTKYTNEDKKILNSTFERIKHYQCNKSLHQAVKLGSKEIPQKLDIKQEVTIFLDDMDLESTKDI